VNPAFKHLDARIRIAELTIRQWVGILLGVILALVYAGALHPFGTMITAFTAVYIGGIPIAVVVVAGYSDFDGWLLLRSALHWRSADERYLPGPGVPTQGYRVREVATEGWSAHHEQVGALDPAVLWGER
jgi:hypothetical protein